MPIETIGLVGGYILLGAIIAGLVSGMVIGKLPRTVVVGLSVTATTLAIGLTALDLLDHVHHQHTRGCETVAPTTAVPSDGMGRSGWQVGAEVSTRAWISA